MLKITIWIVGVGFVLLIGTQVYALNASLRPTSAGDFWLIAPRDWLGAIITVGFGFALAVVLGHDKSKTMAVLDLVASEIIELRSIVGTLKISGGMYSDGSTSVTEVEIHTILNQAATRIRSIRNMVNKRFGITTRPEFNNYTKYLARYKDTITGDNWATRKYTAEEKKNMQLSILKMEEALNNLLSSIYE